MHRGKFVVLATCLLSFAACSGGRHPEVSMTLSFQKDRASSSTNPGGDGDGDSVPGNPPASKPQAVTDMNCIFVSVKGTGIPPRYADGALTGVPLIDCLGIGEVSDTVSVNNAVETGVTLRVRPGLARKIDVYGVSGAPGCGAKTLEEILKKSVPKFYLIGTSTQDLQSDTRVGINNIYDAASSNDVLAGCRSVVVPPMTGDGASMAVSSILEAGDGTKDIYVGGSFFGSLAFSGVTANRLVRVQPNGTVVSSFLTNVGGGFDNDVHCLEPYKDGKFYAGGAFTTFDSSDAGKLIRLNSDGSIDGSFNVTTGAGTGQVLALKTPKNDSSRLYIGGSFSDYNSAPTGPFTALNAVDGSLVTSGGWGTLSAPFSPPVRTIEHVEDASALFVGGGISGSSIAKVSTGGVLSTTFASNLNGQPTGSVYSIRAIPGVPNYIYVGGDFTAIGGASRGRIARVHVNGTVDSLFNAAGTGFDGRVNSIVPVGDITTDIYVAGEFTEYNGIAVKHVARLSALGALRGFFSVGATGFNVTSGLFVFAPTAGLLHDFAIYLGGNFTTLNGVNHGRIVRLGPSGLPL